MTNLIVITLLLLTVFKVNTCLAKTDSSLLNIPLKDLSKIKAAPPGTLTRLGSLQRPNSMTTISNLDIKLTPARNMLDLFEIYIPGVIWMNSESGPLLGMRGGLVDRNFKYLLMLNGVVINDKVHYGAISELEQWDLTDIDRIEVIRGPGSVTYGPGAVSGVINIITFTPDPNQDSQLTLKYVDKYQSKGLSFRKTFSSKLFTLSTHISATRSEGYLAPQYLIHDNDNYGYVGETAFLDAQPLDYFSDYKDKPQVKIHLDAAFNNGFRAWLRYTHQGSTWQGNEVKTPKGDTLINLQGNMFSQFLTNAEYNLAIDSSSTLKTSIGLKMDDTEAAQEHLFSDTVDHVLNKRSNYSTLELHHRTTYNKTLQNSLEIALGYELSYQNITTGWGDSKNDLRLGEGRDIISNENSNALLEGNRGSADRQSDTHHVGNGWKTNSYSIFTEVNIPIYNNVVGLVSARLDKGTFDKYQLSPRFSLINSWSDKTSGYLTLQRSVRRNTAEQRYAENQLGYRTQSESLDSLELGFRSLISEATFIEASIFTNQIDIVSWDDNANESIVLGSLTLHGIEAELEHTFREATLGINFSYIKQKEWILGEQFTRSGISYADYRQPLRNTDATQQDSGNNINNWPNYSLKTYAHIPLGGKYYFHADLRYISKFQGAIDGLNGLEDAVRGLPEEEAVAVAIQSAYDVDTYAAEVRLNLSLSYIVNPRFETKLFFHNAYGSRNNPRYSEDSGNNRASPRRVRFREEPATIGLELAYSFD